MLNSMILRNVHKTLETIYDNDTFAQLIDNLENSPLLEQFASSQDIKRLLAHKEDIKTVYSRIVDERSKSFFIREIGKQVLEPLLGTDFCFKLMGRPDIEELFRIAFKYYEDGNGVRFPDELVDHSNLRKRERSINTLFLMLYNNYYLFGAEQYRYTNLNHKNPIDLRAGSEDIVFDVGSCMGETAYYFSNVCGAKEVHGFDISLKMINMGNKVLELNKANSNIHIHHLGLSDTCGEFEFSEDNTFNNVGMATIFKPIKQEYEDYKDPNMKINTYKVPLQTLDQFVLETNIKPTIIKADIEGAEHNLLRGASNYIKEHHPDIFISVYHKPNDFFSLAMYLLSLRPDYKFCFKKVDTYWETVMFATTKDL